MSDLARPRRNPDSAGPAPGRVFSPRRHGNGLELTRGASLQPTPEADQQTR